MNILAFVLPHDNNKSDHLLFIVTEMLTGNSTTEFPVKEGGTWATLAILAGLILAVILTFVIILTLFLCILQRKSRYRLAV